jgi:rhomboid protease GluP
MKNSLSNCLLNLGFTKVEVNAKDILLTYREVNGEIYIAAAFFLYTGEELTIEQHQHILFQIKRDFVNRGYQTVHLLSILCTGNPNKVKEFCLPPDNHWVIFLPAKKLIIYENQTPDFIGLKAAIEDLLVKESSLGYENSQIPHENDERETTSLSGQNHRGFSDLKKGLAMLTLMNTIIVGLNIVIFMIVRNTNLFGGMEGMWKNWSCNWYPIRYQKEYYRIISSMFLHANTSHLFNNMVILIFIGGYFERAVGRIRYLLIYLGSGIVVHYSPAC